MKRQPEKEFMNAQILIPALTIMETLVIGLQK